MILAIKTATGVAELRLLSREGQTLAEADWPADRNLADGLLAHIAKMIKREGAVFSDLTGLVVFKGPGSFTGLRIGITVMNTLSYALDIPIVGAASNNWQKKGLHALKDGHNDRLVLPEYGAEARITPPKH
ncbi:MAG TPA: tRNA (adenosine(37)-N6)-threonylcarbamoyltransferase complex dimerization subunit type 1 TsaB [Candidatus Saccharimonadales bacterium]|nr:tRNA (adenosine(37)-N6)-threonylcarbamoyltransferase complex dimerization subunit type 1 TsaB [Candidatus Saccharimonadales bacterium]